MLKHRILTACGLFILVSGILFGASATVFAGASWLLCLIAIYELARMYRFTLKQVSGLIILTTGLAASLTLFNADLNFLLRIIAVITWCFVVPLVLLFLPHHFAKAAITLFAVLLFVPAYYALTFLHTTLGAWQLVSIMAIAWVADTGAYIIGKCWGKHKLAPQISPGKSIEGALGGLLLVSLYLITLQHFNLAYYLATPKIALKFAFILSLVSILGDLFESWLKRVAQVKDSGSLLPGHGGIFDRIDSLVAVLAIAFALVQGIL